MIAFRAADPSLPGSLRSTVAVLAALALVVASCGSAPTPAPTAQGVPGPSPMASGAPSSSPSSAPTPVATPSSFPLAVVARLTDLRASISSADLAAAVGSGAVTVPCGLTAISVAGATMPVPRSCTTAADIPAALSRAGSSGAAQPSSAPSGASSPSLARLPAGLVDPRVKVLAVDGADLFGNTVVRTRPYPVTGSGAPDTPELPSSATAWDPNDIRTIVSTGDTCPDRAVSHWANVMGKGWDWTLQGGTARYTGIGMDTRFTGPTGNGWPVVRAVRTGQDVGAVWSVIHDADIAVNDFECPMVANFTQHDHGTYFTIDPKVAGLFARVGMDFASLGSNHGTDLGASGISQTLAYFDKVGVKYSGAGSNVSQAMQPAVFDVRGVRFAFLSWDATGVSRAATANGWGELHPTAENVAAAVGLARSQADVVVVMPQWNFPEYSAPFTKQALAERDAWFAAGVDHILGSGTHWASAMSITQPDPSKGWRLAVTSHGNFLFGQDWSRQTQEGLIYEVTFRGTHLVQVRVHPYVVMDGAQPNLTDPTTDGAYVQKQVLGVSQLP